MGCGASDLNPSRKGTVDRKRKQKATSIAAAAATANKNPFSAPSSAADASHINADGNYDDGGGGGSPTSLLGKQRYIAENGAVVMAKSDASNGLKNGGQRMAASAAPDVGGHLIVYTNAERSNLVFVFAEGGSSAAAAGGSPSGALGASSDVISSGASSAHQQQRHLYVREFSTDDELIKAKTEARVSLPWAPFFKSIASDVIKGKAIISPPTMATGGGGGAMAPKEGNTSVTSAGGHNTNNNNVAGGGGGGGLFRSATFTITSSKDPSIVEAFTVRMPLLTKAPSPRELALFVLIPMARMAQTASGKDQARELRVAKAANARFVAMHMIGEKTAEIQRVRHRIAPLRQNALEKASESRQIALKLSQLEHKVARRMERYGIADGSGVVGGGAANGQQPPHLHRLDQMYLHGGPQPFEHGAFAQRHVPRMPTVNEPLATLLAKSLAPSSSSSASSTGASTGASSSSPNEAGAGPSSSSPASATIVEYSKLAPLTQLLRAPSADPALVRTYQIVTPQLANGVMTTLHKLEDWDFNVFELERLTGGNALFYTAYAVLNRLNLVNHFKIDDKILMNFLRGVQAGYHPNPYHNKTHAADVCQTNYFMLSKGGLMQTCKLTREDLLSSVLAAAIHDYDHPGFNNNFHTRTNAYLSTLYNDRSILENHHLACVFEMMRLPQFDIFKNLSDEQRRTVRETMIEMVLATDMGNHARIYDSFKRALVANGGSAAASSSDQQQQQQNNGGAASQQYWAQKDAKTDAMNMALKLADISNCSRPSHLYMEWGKNISAEFYMQGDAEAKLSFTVSPFMDRKKDKTDFPKGQISFMNYIVIPMLDTMCELLPELNTALAHCQKNKEGWNSALQRGM